MDLSDGGETGCAVGFGRRADGDVPKTAWCGPG